MIITLQKTICIGLYIFTLGMMSSNAQSQTSQSFTSFPETKELHFDNVFEYMEGYPGIFRVIDSTLVLFNVNIQAQKYLYTYALNKGKLSEGFLNRGRGPGESTAAFMFGNHLNSVWVYDIVTKRIHTSNLSENAFSSIKTYQLKHRYYMLSCLDSIHYLGIGDTKSDFKVNKINMLNGQITQSYGNYHDKPKDTSLQAYKEANECFIHSKPDGTKAVLAYKYTDKIDIYDLSNGKYITQHGPDQFTA